MRFTIFLLSIAACTGTIETTGGTGDPAPDAAVATGGTGGSGSGSGSGGATGSGSGSGSGSGTTCKNIVSAGLLSGHHNPGRECLSCHNGSTAPVFTLGGTLYTSSGSALAGGTITVVDANGASFDVVSQLNGNFYTSQALVFPISVTGSACPTTTAMVSQVQAGGCAAGGCHVAGAQGPIHL